MYERFSVGDITWPGTSPLFTPSPGFVVENQLPVPTAIAEQDYILFVHGWGMEPWEKERFAETAFKRLYWLKYRGRFGLFKWPTYYLTGGLLHELAFEQVNFDRSEFNGWLSGTGLNSLCGYLNQRFPGRVRMFSHSLGAVPSGEALRLFGVNKPLHTYVASQAAISVHCYNPNPAFNMPFIGVLNDHTPNVYAEFWATGSPQYFLNIQGANFFMNYYNAKDWALGANIWQVNQMTKPDNSIGYSYTQTTPPQNGFSKNATALSFPVDTYEIFSFGAESRSHALGTIANAGGAFLAQGQIDLDATFLFGEQHVGHSAQFRSNIQARRAYWNSLRSSFGIPQ